MAPKAQRDKKQKSTELQPHTVVGSPSKAVDRSNSPIFFHKEWEDFGFMSNFHAGRFTAPAPETWLSYVTDKRHQQLRPVQVRTSQHSTPSLSFSAFGTVLHVLQSPLFR